MLLKKFIGKLKNLYMTIGFQYSGTKKGSEKPNGRKVVNRLFGYSVNWCEAGFTFIEVILVVGILSLIAAVTTPLFARFLAKNHIETTTTTVMGFLRKAQENAMDGKNDATWGVCVTGSTLRMYSNTCAAPPCPCQ